MDEVCPKKPKTCKSQQPRPAVGPLLAVVREVWGGEREGCVNMLTGSVEVAAPQSNIVISVTDPWRSGSQASLEEDNVMEKDISEL